MSYSIALSSPVRADDLRAAFDEQVSQSFPVAEDGSVEVPAAVRDHLGATIGAVEAWLVNVVGHRGVDTYMLRVSGHANPGHWPAQGWADETIAISLTVIPAEVATQATPGAGDAAPTAGSHEPTRDIPVVAPNQPPVPAAEVAANQPDTNPGGTTQPGGDVAATPLHPLQQPAPVPDVAPAPSPVAQEAPDAGDQPTIPSGDAATEVPPTPAGIASPADTPSVPETTTQGETVDAATSVGDGGEAGSTTAAATAAETPSDGSGSQDAGAPAAEVPPAADASAAAAADAPSAPASVAPTDAATAPAPVVDNPADQNGTPS